MVKVENNLIKDQKRFGVLQRGLVELELKYNIFTGNKGAIIKYAKSRTSPARHVVEYNTLWNNEMGYGVWGPREFSDEYGVEPETFREDPMFVDPGNGYFAIANPNLIANEQGLLDPEVFVVLWGWWVNRGDETVPFGIW